MAHKNIQTLEGAEIEENLDVTTWMVIANYYCHNARQLTFSCSIINVPSPFLTAVRLFRFDSYYNYSPNMKRGVVRLLILDINTLMSLT